VEAHRWVKDYESAALNAKLRAPVAYIILQRKDLVRSNDLLLLGRLGASFGAGSAVGAPDEQVHGAKVCCGAIQGHSG